MYIDILIIGGGVIGLSLASELKAKYPKKEIVLCEKDQYLGDQTSGRNSGVLHSGVYYTKNSHKHLLTLRGLELWDDFAQKHNFPINRCGKFITAHNIDELSELRENGLSNGLNIQDIVKNEEQIIDYSSCKYSMFIPATAVVCPSSLIKMLESICDSVGVIILKGRAPVINEDLCLIDGEEFTPSLIINSAGLSAIEFRKSLNLLDFESYFVRGDYLKYTKEYYNKSLIYPMPNKELNTLGIHTCIAPDNSIFFGPNSQEIDKVDYHQSEQLIDNFYEEIKLSFKCIEKESLQLHYAGIRPKIKKDGQVLKDFHFEKHQFEKFKYVELLGIESPGLTCCFSIAEKVINEYL